ncbi:MULTISPECIES: TetR/AcrR family transcriptional regulator [unclassified Psychrobacter]|uniref:TetR/AcrR family transcriptional regulator n=1 Tax=unclassified Psychrobacter TaxID=196806 RepID=UPI0025B4D96F|nr:MULTISPECIES: TetR/AcrR family transcriptional regulator [unclassified Psychrobacter]MDN3453135.1 TetR/AcrR family transcriptional regulator [Psychrobacter sp. APC 3350]MDN3501934.1 TetR/AcrR family transcriptional regulator [Psychrobacter sp. 5A.1]
MELRDTILQKSYELLYKQGFHNSGVELLAKQAGTTKRTLYAHFGSKDGLIEAVLKYRHQMFMAQLKACFDNVESKDAADVVTCYLAFLKDWTSSEGFYGCLFINACAEYSDTQSSPYQIAKQHKAEVRQWLFDALEQLGINNAKQKSDILFVLGEGSIVTAQTGQESLALDANFLKAFD